jgi:hypothetical protein
MVPGARVFYAKRSSHDPSLQRVGFIVNSGALTPFCSHSLPSSSLDDNPKR